ncbi:hypothetical protein FT663_03307 [Candidozyma haemuli var. vulneris]|uniref:Uncharacterized protein n=1 Tax=Candidozyma haemuli TaxID=45357 RepID=A0A2V1AU02_9ASCO|nr:hypothetical protein CXQ85_000291 [[Candida] haemuloni]KAF3988455.1 hypothetical protein FT662_03404 [[Candida] haemuloni var. vulneris]KAF3990158.1 hypothetical protein FT663_03307 [[Candida] haemuloni var. vulneris]PVH21318.1 hypothetical protein CXQ85_000291 [[Candida] haemuloni]
MARTINPIIIIVAIVTILLVVFKTPGTKDKAVDTYSSVTDTVQDAWNNNYILSFEPTKKAKSTEEAEKLKNDLDQAVEDYRNYLEKDLGSKVKHTYDSATHGLSVQIEETQQLLKALGKKAVGKANKHETLLTDKLQELFYKLKGDDLKRLGIKIKLEKDKLVNINN